jgi:hypothetical protein
VHDVPDNERVEAQVPSDRLFVDNVNWASKADKTPTIRNNIRVNPRKEKKENFANRDRACAMIAMVLLARRAANLPGMEYLLELTKSNSTNLPRQFVVTISCFPSYTCPDFIWHSASLKDGFYLPFKHLYFIFMKRLSVDAEDMLMYQPIFSKTTMQTLLEKDPQHTILVQTPRRLT